MLQLIKSKKGRQTREKCSILDQKSKKSFLKSNVYKVEKFAQNVILKLKRFQILKKSSKKNFEK